LTLISCLVLFFFFFFTAPPTPEIYTLSLHDALPIFADGSAPVPLRSFATEPAALLPPDHGVRQLIGRVEADGGFRLVPRLETARSEEHTSELQSRRDLVCRLLLEKKKKKKTHPRYHH